MWIQAITIWKFEFLFVYKHNNIIVSKFLVDNKQNITDNIIEIYDLRILYLPYIIMGILPTSIHYNNQNIRTPFEKSQDDNIVNTNLFSLN